MAGRNETGKRLDRLQQHLRQESPILEKVVQSFRGLDRIYRKTGFLLPGESHALRTPWWPLISVLGTYSSGKSTFLNTYLGQNLQNTGNQAVDDRFTVMCYTQQESRRLPGLALDSDPRFPLYRIGRAIEETAPGEGQHVDSFLQLKTCPSPKLKGKILIDSPGFDADAQRTSTLRITDRIVDLSDLVLVFFDARHPEAGSMRDTLDHLVKSTLQRKDSSKFLYILNQIDVTAGEDNPEEVFAAWQRSLAQNGLTAGRTYSIFDPHAAVPMEDESQRRRYHQKMETDLRDIYQRMEQVQVERAYRVVGMLEESAQQLENKVVPAVKEFIRGWRQRVLFTEGALLGLVLALFLGVTIWGGYWQGVQPQFELSGSLFQPPWIYVGAGVLLLALMWAHFSIRRRAAHWVAQKMASRMPEQERKSYMAAFAKNTRWWRSMFRSRPAGWSRRSERGLDRIKQDVKRFIEELNDTYADPSGDKSASREE